MDSLGDLQQLYDSNRFIQAYERLCAGPDPTEPEARLLAARILTNVGAPRRARFLVTTAFRQKPTEPTIAWFYVFEQLGRRGPLVALDLLQRLKTFEGASAQYQSNWWVLSADVLGLLRDFAAAGEKLARAEKLWPDNPWLWFEKARLLDLEDMQQEAVLIASAGLEIQRWYRPTVHLLAHILQKMNRRDEALSLLRGASEQIESYAIASQLALLERELGDYGSSLQSWYRAAALAPAMEMVTFQWLAAELGMAHYLTRDFDRAAELFQLSKPPLVQMGERIEKAKLPSASPSEFFTSGNHRPDRVVLPVPHVSQHRMTCGPATLAAISEFWSRPAAHLSVAEEICYDGTPTHSERHWAETHGYRVQEFTVTEESAVTLIDRGVPFTLVTTRPDSAHLQAVVGYDRTLRTLICRDPSFPYRTEGDAAELINACASSGPRGMALVPVERKEKLDIDLPDAELRDRLYQMQRALVTHDRETAAKLFAAMEEELGSHPLALHAKFILAAYDNNQQAALEAADGLLERYPKDARLLLLKIAYLKDLSRTEERLALLAEKSRKADAEPLLWKAYAQTLADDGRERDLTEFLLRRTIRRRPDHYSAYEQLAQMLWLNEKRDEALRLFRLAACLNQFDEGTAKNYLLAAIEQRRTDEALDFLNERFSRLGKSSSLPARTLAFAYQQIHQTHQALDTCDRALALRPKDGGLQLFSATVYSRAGQRQRAASLLEAAQGTARRTEWLRAAADLAIQQLRPRDALSSWQEVLLAEPLAVDAHREVVRLSTLTDLDPRRARKHLEEVTARFPNHLPLALLRLEWVQIFEPWRTLTVLQQMVELHSHHAKLRRDLAFALTEEHRLASAKEQLHVAHGLEPETGEYHWVRARLLERSGNPAGAAEAYRDSLLRCVDVGAPVRDLLQLSESRAALQKDLDFLIREFRRQPLRTGEGLRALRDATGRLFPAPVLDFLREAYRARPSLWFCGAVLVDQLLAMRQLDTAARAALEQKRQFPFVPEVWLNLARVQSAGREPNKAAESLSRALDLNPSFAPAVRELARIRESMGAFAESQTILERLADADSSDTTTALELARFHRRRGDSAAALARIGQALRANPSQPSLWTLLIEWADQLKERARIEPLVQELSTSSPEQPYVWIARALTADVSRSNERLEAVERALSIWPRMSDAHDLRTRLLMEAGRLDAAMDSCVPACFSEGVPETLRGRAIWIKAQLGARAEALSNMNSLLSQYPRYGWGWMQATDWSCAEQEFDQSVQAAERIVLLAPDSPVGYGYLGESYRAWGKHAAAKEAFQTSIEVDPNFTFGWLRVCDELIFERKYDQAKALLVNAAPITDRLSIAVREVQIGAATSDRASVKKGFLEICRTVPLPERALAQAIEALQPLDQRDRAFPLLDEAVNAESANPILGRYWIDHHRPFQLGLWRRLRELRARGEIGAEATARYFEHLEQHRQAIRLKAFLWRHRRELEQDTQLCARAGATLINLGAYSAALRWLQICIDRGQLEPWVCLNYSLAARATEQHNAAASAIERCLDKSPTPADHQLVVWRAYDLALAERNSEAETIFKSVERGKCNEFYQYVISLTELLLAPTSGRSKEQIESLRSRSTSLPRRRLCHQTLREIWRRDGVTGSRKWLAAWQSRHGTTRRPATRVSPDWWLGVYLLLALLALVQAFRGCRG